MSQHIHIHVGNKATKDAPNGQRFIPGANARITRINNTKIDLVPTEATPRQAMSCSQSIVDLNVLIKECKLAIEALKQIEDD